MMLKNDSMMVCRPFSARMVLTAVRRASGRWLAFLAGSLLVLLCGWSGTADADDQFLDPAAAFVATAAMPDPQTLDVHYAVAPGYYMYQERFEVRVEDAQKRLLLYRPSTLTPPDLRPTGARWNMPVVFPHGRVKYDPTFEKDMEVYHGGVTLRIPLRAGAAAPLRVSVTGQGCADRGLCYPPMTQTLQLVAAAGGYRAQGPQVRASVPGPVDEAVASASRSAGAGAGRLNLIAGRVSAAGSAKAASAAAGAALAPRAVSSAGPVDSGTSWLDLGDTGMAAWLHQAPLWQILGLSLVFGILLSLTPCVLPMIPILLVVVSGGRSGSTSRARGLGLAAAYVLGLSLVYTALGVVAGLLGAGLAAWLQSPWVIGAFAVLLALFALAMLGVFTLQVPVGLQSAIQMRLQRLPGGRAGGVFVMGMLSALIVGPCVAAPLAGVLLFISQTGDVVVGGSALFAMAWGEGLILLAVGAGSGALLPRAGAWMETLKTGFGLLLLATAWWMARPLLGEAWYVAGWVLLAFWAALLLWSAAGAAVGDLSASSSAGIAIATAAPLRLLLRALALTLLAWGLAQGAGLLAGGRDMLRPLAPFAARGAGGAAGLPVAGASADPATIRARFTRVTSLDDLRARIATADRPVMLDFYADWCVSCIEMEKFTFSDPQVAARMDRMLLLQADVTRMTPEDLALLKQFNLFGPPGILFFDARGQTAPVGRVVGFLKADAFGRIQDRVLGRVSG
jgi:thiol:disulfide interchange protein DsbD